jgi:alkylated DNA repair dioxygenase AlkB
MLQRARACACALDTHTSHAANNIHRAGQWGWRFFTWNRVPPMSPADRLAPLPRWMRDVVAALEAADGAREYLPSREEWGSGVQHALLNEYEPGDGVTPHTDDLFYWTSWVLGLSLGSDVTMRFHPPPPAADACDACACLPPGPVEVRLPRRSVYVLSGDARWTWKHEIARATEDTVDGQLVPRGYRASVTLRGIAARWLPPELVDGVVTGSSEA